jgi:hypothetical protein
VDRDGHLREVPEGWERLPPGDAACTRRVKAGPHWVVEERAGRRTYSRGIWAPAETIAAIVQALEAERSTDAYARKAASGKARREREQVRYEGDFEAAVLDFLAFAPIHSDLARMLAHRVAVHATPVGSGTVARTERIPIAERAEAAVIAWMRHQTTRYDQLAISRANGARREVRRDLARSSRELLNRYRRGLPAEPGCALQEALGDEDVPEAPRAPVQRALESSERVSLFARLKQKIR